MLSTIGKLDRKAGRWATRGKPWRKKLVLGVSIGIVAGGFGAVILGPAYGIAALGCRGDWSDSGREWRYRAVGGCQVKDKGGWIPASNVRAVD
ncbi:hypothetical protein IPV08_08285 [Methylobacterium sp. SD274]|jgi:hypothetical protein|uniref:Uncharacterized protein n=1 Tax=Methylobacterium gossipiicola TaxID=582675 RepID=A0A1I2UZB5_9HYPH|nr:MULTISPECIES: hypothetical protein [Methylobacterium]MBO1019961.1 hypothetical protein [Methylobacterium sp. SD274]SFG82484.1 hypothetical protein SAMN05192565_112109 [Methylobacterium gossipiicola]